MTLPANLPREELVELVKEALQEHAPLVEMIEEFRAPPTIARVEAVEQMRMTEQPEVGATATSMHGEPRPRLLRGAPTEPAVPARVQSPGKLMYGRRARQPAPTREPAWTPEQERRLAEILRQDESCRVWLGSLEITELIRRQWERGLFSGALGELPELKGGVLAAAELGAISSPLGGPKGERAGPRGFWFNINAELVIYGATECDARVTIGGRAIKLRSDGSFSYRFALPDGQYALPVVARSADGEDTRQAELKFARDTHYVGAVEAHPQAEGLKPPRAEHVS
jgi:hypothetical protein